MRFFLILIIFAIMAFLPSGMYARHILKRKKEFTSSIVLMFALPTLSLLAFALLVFATRLGYNMKVLEWIMWLMLLTMVPQNIYAVFYGLDDIIYLFTKCNRKWMHYMGATLAAVSVVVMIVGMATRHCLKVREVTIYSKNLPKEFDGMKIAHITDLHMGNLSPRDKYLEKIITKLNDIEPDMLVCTGDMVNLSAEELVGLDGLFEAIDAPLGRYAVMGNHDYGEYKKWNSEEAKAANLMATYEAYRRVGFVLLNDSAVEITIPLTEKILSHTEFTEHTENDSLCSSSQRSSINVIGVENCGKEPFPCYGDLAEATEGIEPAGFNILLSHDPNHWDEEVVGDEYKYIDLTLSGHTHSAQLGVDLGIFKYSPSQWIFRQWDGLYQKGSQYLFVSRGLGYVGIPFRLGMSAEISVIELRSEN